MPPPCAADADGFLLTDRLALEPNLSFSRTAGEVTAHHVDAQFIWSARGLCTRALAAETEGMQKRGSAPVVRSAETKPSNQVPLVVSERRPEGRRWGFRCGP